MKEENARVEQFHSSRTEIFKKRSGNSSGLVNGDSALTESVFVAHARTHPQTARTEKRLIHITTKAKQAVIRISLLTTQSTACSPACSEVEARTSGSVWKKSRRPNGLADHNTQLGVLTFADFSFGSRYTTKPTRLIDH